MESTESSLILPLIGTMLIAITVTLPQCKLGLVSRRLALKLKFSSLGNIVKSLAKANVQSQ